MAGEATSHGITEEEILNDLLRGSFREDYEAVVKKIRERMLSQFNDSDMIELRMSIRVLLDEYEVDSKAGGHPVHLVDFCVWLLHRKGFEDGVASVHL